MKLAVFSHLQGEPHRRALADVAIPPTPNTSKFLPIPFARIDEYDPAYRMPNY
jgi:hypothetical protein